MNKQAIKQKNRNTISVWYSRLSGSEQKLISIGGLLIILVLIWLLVYQPVTDHINKQVIIKDRVQGQLQQMQKMAETVAIDPTTTVIPIPIGVTFSSWADQQLRAVNLQDMVNRTEPIDENSLSIWLQGAPFDQVIDWIQQISTQYAVQVDQIDINVTDESLGLTNIRMRLVK